MRRPSVVLAALAAALALAAPAGAKPWAHAEIATVVAAGLMAPSAAEFRPGDALTKGELAELVAALGGKANPPAEAGRAVKLRELDAALVRLLGLDRAAKHVRSTLADAGLSPRPYAGTETLARLAGLRTNHPEAQDARELLPNDPVTRAETAYSVARVLELQAGGGAKSIAAQAASLELPELTDWQRRVLTRAVRYVGHPYIWGGSSESSQSPFGVAVPGGFDCSGFTWRIYKLEPYADAPQLADVLQGRTSYVMSGEVGRAKRLGWDAIQPADVLFFGDRGRRSRPREVGHMGIYLGGGWMAHASSRGTTLVPVEGWYAERFAWARRPLAEAGLVS